MNPTPKDRFRGALMGSLLGPIYYLQWRPLEQDINGSASEPPPRLAGTSCDRLAQTSLGATGELR